MSVKLKRSVIYRGRQYQPGEDIPADTAMVAVWESNDLILTSATSDQEPSAEWEYNTPSKTEGLSAPTPPGLVAGGSGAESEMSGRDSRKRGS